MVLNFQLEDDKFLSYITQIYKQFRNKTNKVYCIQQPSGTNQYQFNYDLMKEAFMEINYLL